MKNRNDTIDVLEAYLNQIGRLYVQGSTRRKVTNADSNIVIKNLNKQIGPLKVKAYLILFLYAIIIGAGCFFCWFSAERLKDCLFAIGFELFLFYAVHEKMDKPNENKIKEKEGVKDTIDSESLTPEETADFLELLHKILKRKEDQSSS